MFPPYSTTERATHTQYNVPSNRNHPKYSTTRVYPNASDRTKIHHVNSTKEKKETKLGSRRNKNTIYSPNKILS